MEKRQEKKAAFELIDGIILVAGAINGISGHFAVDTGATRTVLNRTYCAQATDATETNAVTFDGGMQSSEISRKDKEIISVAGEEIELKSVPIMDMDYVERPLRKTNANLVFLGSIGADMLGVGRLIIDYHHHQVIFNAAKIPENAETVKLFVEKLPIVALEIQQSTFRFVLDTGANHFVMDQAAAPKEAIAPSSDKDEPHSIKSLRFAGKEYKNLTGIVTDLSSLREQLHVDGIIGYQILKEYVCCFDYADGLLYLAQ